MSEPLTGPRQTNQRAELTAILRALELAPLNREVTIFSDSNYAINCVTTWFQNWRKNGWHTSSKKPVDADEPGNVAADELAVRGARFSKTESASTAT